MPITTYEDLIEIFFKRYNESPLPEKFLENEKVRIQKMIDKENGPINRSYNLEYDAIVNCDEVVFDFESKDNWGRILKPYLGALTYPIAKYRIFLERQKSELFNEINPDMELKRIEIEIRNLIIMKLELLTVADIKKKINGEIYKSLEEKVGKEKSKDLHGTTKREKTVKFWIDMTDFSDLKQTITQKNYWSLFESTFGNKTKLVSEFEDLINLRNPIRHAREITSIVMLKGKGSILWFKEQLKMS